MLPSQPTANISIKKKKKKKNTSPVRLLPANRPFTVKWPVRLGLLLPWALPLVVRRSHFRWFFEYNTGVVNNWLGSIRSRAVAMAVEPDVGVLGDLASRSCGRRRRSWR